MTSTCPSQSRPGADADGRDGHLVRDLAGELARDPFEHDGVTARLLQRTGVVDSLRGRRLVAALHLEAAQLVEATAA